MIYHGDCLDILPTLDANSVDAVVTDPPYGLGFMGKAWDTFDPAFNKSQVKKSKYDETMVKTSIRKSKLKGYAPPSQHAGLYDQSAQGHRNFQSWCESWAREVYRVAKPGAFMLVSGGTRTFHRMTSGLEDAGWEIRDCMMWLYGSGFPKSHDVSKAIDKAAGAERIVLGPKKDISHVERGDSNIAEQIDTSTDSPFTSKGAPMETAPSTDAARQWSGWGTALKPAWEPIIVARKPLEGTVAENVLKWGTGGMNIDGSRIGTESIKTQAKDGMYGAGSTEKMREQGFRPYRIDNRECPESTHQGRWPANVILDEEAGAMLDGQSGVSKSTANVRHNNPSPNVAMSGANLGHTSFGHDDSGGASRFFYCAKTSKKERGEGNNHPTVKPISLLTYLARLVCPPGGVILDPFMGSGSMGIAAQNLGFDFIGIEKEEQYCEIAKGRLGLVAA